MQNYFNVHEPKSTACCRGDTDAATQQLCLHAQRNLAAGHEAVEVLFQLICLQEALIPCKLALVVNRIFL